MPSRGRRWVISPLAMRSRRATRAGGNTYVSKLITITHPDAGKGRFLMRKALSLLCAELPQHTNTFWPPTIAAFFFLFSFFLCGTRAHQGRGDAGRLTA